MSTLKSKGSKDFGVEQATYEASEPWEVKGVGSSSKVFHTLGAPVTLNGTSNSVSAPVRPNTTRQQSIEGDRTGIFASLRKASLSFPSNNSNKATSPEHLRLTNSRSPPKAKLPLRSTLARTMSTSDAEDDEDEYGPRTPEATSFVVSLEQSIKRQHSLPDPASPISPTTLSPLTSARPALNRGESRASLKASDAEPMVGRDVLRARAGSGSSVPRGSPIPSALDGSMLLNSPSFVGPSVDAAVTAAAVGAPKADGQIEEIVPWLFQPTNESNVELSPRSRQRSFTAAPTSKTQGLRSAKSSSALKPSISGDVQSSPEKRSKTKGLFGMLRRKTSTGEGLRNGSVDLDSDSLFSNPFSDTSSGPRSSATHPNGDAKRARKSAKGSTRAGRDVSLSRGPVKAAGVSLDTNLDSMEGIVAADTLADSAVIEGVVPPEALRRRLSNRPAGLGLTSSIDTDGVHSQGRLGRRSSDGAAAGFDPMGSLDRRASTFSLSLPGVHPVTPSPTSDARPTGLNASTATVTPAPGAVWTAPDSWGVHPELNQERLSSSGESDDEDASTHQSASEKGTRAPNTPLVNVAENDRPIGRPGSAGMRFSGAPPGRRPGTANSITATGLTAAPKTVVSGAVRIYKPDGTHTVLSCPLNMTAGEMQQVISRKPGFAPTKAVYRLFVKERGLERSLAPSERPLMLQRRRLEQAGYLETDKLEEIGREDHSYLVKFIYRPEAGPAFGSTDDDQLDGFEYVSLDARGLQTIPIFLYRHAHELVSLNLSKNPKLELPSDFIQACLGLRELRMTEMGIKRIPQSVRQANGLTRLDVSNNRLVELDHTPLDELTELLSLKASNNRLSQLPDYFGRFQSLKYLIISNNKFEVLPLAVCEIVSLVDLDVSFNSLTTLPASISSLVHLERLILFGNAITSLPASLSELARLRELDCRRNSISNFAFLDELKALEVVRLQHNAASAIQTDTVCMRTFNASYNPITKLQMTGSAATLTNLTVTHANLSSLPAELFAEALTALEILVVDNNSIRSLPDSLGSCSSLIRLSCRSNHIDALPPWIGKLQRLQELDASNNDIGSVAEEIWMCGGLVTLNLSSNLLSEFPDPPKMPVSDDPTPVEDDRKASVASQRSGARVMVPAASSLQRLFMADNRLTDETFQPISLMVELRVLNLSFNELYEIPSRALAKNANLEELYLSGNMLTTLPEEEIARLINLRILHLNGNKLQTLPAELGQLKKLHVLDVGCNVLKYNIANWKFDWNWNWNTDLRYLNLSGNKRLEIKPAGQQAMHALEAMEESPSSAKRRRNLSDFTAMKKLRILGLMDVTLTIPTVPEDSEDRRVRTSLPEINGMGYGIADALGRSEELTMVDMVIRRFRGREEEGILGIFDGRLRARGTIANSGSRIAKYLQDCFVSALSLELSKTARLKSQLAASGADPEDLPSDAEDANESLRRTFLNLNRDYGNILLPYFDARRKDSDVAASAASFNLASGSSSDVRSGATGLVIYMQGNTMHVANVGDALAVMASRGGAARLMSVKHDPQAPEEVARIRASEGFVSHKGLVNDEVEISRSFGHYHVFPAMNASPHVTTFEVVEGDEFLILGSKGLWDYMGFQAAVDCARRERADPMAAAQKLRDLAIAYGSSDNVMVMVIAVGDLFKTKQGPVVSRGRAAESGEAEIYAGQKAGRRGQLATAPGERYLTLLDREVAPPVGNVALVFTDIRNSTMLWETNPGMMQTSMRMHNQLLRRQLRSIGGYEVKTEGDAFMVSFPSVTSALLWCFTIQIELLREDWPQSLLDSEEGREMIAGNGELLYRGLSVRMGIHWGQPVCESDPITRRMDYFGPVVNRAARISGVADGGQVSCSSDALEVIKTLCGLDDPEANDAEDLETFETRLAADPELDDNTKRDVLVIRKLGVGILELGERRLKGLETPENLYLLYPSQLAGRLKSTALESPALMASPDHALISSAGSLRRAEIFEPIPQLLDSLQMSQLGRLTLRMEQAMGLMTHPLIEPSSPSTGYARASSFGIRRRVHPFLLHSPVPLETTDEELLAFLENFVVRLENLVAAFQLRQMGSFNSVLSALSLATDIDSRQLIQALSMFASVTGQNGRKY